ncbi:histidine phosphatase family protein [uncultured Maricaulis sp.]|uniref:histidine phosphatase family protein n=1 Tax=uncultured Maricaulis sp. TaxID=174710 RepID=UPI0026196334|nr:histidine phosphatase family protein [uncultured Maricaulis sp.]
MKSIFIAAGVLVGLSACSPSAQSGAHPELLALVPDADRAEIAAADQHVLVVRHALKISPDCNGMDCPLSADGERMVERLAELVGSTPFDRAYSSAACRTRLTAAASGTAVIAHQAVDGYAVGCTESETVTRVRADAYAEVDAGDAVWTLVGEHSNTSCLWMSAYAGADAAQNAGCDSEGRLPEDAYGDIYWLYRTGEDWSLTVLPGAFSLDD